MADNLFTWSTDGAAHTSWSPAALPDPEPFDFIDCDPRNFATNSSVHYLPLDLLNARAAASDSNHMAPPYTQEAMIYPDSWYSSDSMHEVVQPAVQQSLDPASNLPTQTTNGNSSRVSGILVQGHQHALEPRTSRTVVCIHDLAANSSPSASRHNEVGQGQTEVTPRTENAREEKPLCQWKDCTHTKPFNRKEDVLRHVKSIHLSIKSYKCGVRGCLRSFSRRDKIKDHIVKNHSSFAQAWEQCVVYDG